VLRDLNVGVGHDLRRILLSMREVAKNHLLERLLPTFCHTGALRGSIMNG